VLAAVAASTAAAATILKFGIRKESPKVQMLITATVCPEMVI